MAEPRTILIPYKPRPLQLGIHNSLKRFNVLVCHRRFGKTVFAVNEIIKCAITCQRERPRFAYIAPYYNQSKSVAWDYFKHYTSVIPGVKYNESELRVDLPNGARINLYGADNPDKLRGIYLDGAVLDEVGDMSPRVWGEVIRPAIADRLGWVIFIGTSKGRNHFWKVYNEARTDPDWLAANYKASQTGIVPESELALARKAMSEDQYNQEFENDFSAALVGAYYGKEMTAAEVEGRICSVPYTPSAEVHVSWDLGYGDTTALWFIQIVGRETRIIDYYEASGVGLDHYVNIIKGKPYNYGTQILPHDAGHGSLRTGSTLVTQLKEMGLRDTEVLPRDDVDPGIQLVRQLLPSCWFDAVKCDKGLEALRNYQKKFNETTQTFSQAPLHNWASDGADSFRYAAVWLTREHKATVPQSMQNLYGYSGFGNSSVGWMGMLAYILPSLTINYAAYSLMINAI